MGRKDKITAFLGENTLFEGHLSFEGTLQIDGRYKGKISASGNLIIGKKAMVESDIHVSSIFVSGEVHGNVVAEERIEIQVPGKVFGDIQAPEVIIHGGVIFEGNCQTKSVNAPENAKLTLINSDQQDDFQNGQQNRIG